MGISRALTVAAAVAAVLALCGCSSTSQSIADALDQSHAAVASVALAERLESEERLPPSSLSASITDALTELEDAQFALTELRPTATEVPERDRALSAVRDAVDAVLGIRDALAMAGDRDSARNSARDQLVAADEELRQ